MNLVFTEEYISSIPDPSEHFERGFSTLLATNPYFSELRERLERIVHSLPKNYKPRFINNLKSTKDKTCLSSISELFVYEKLVLEFNPVEIETTLEIVDNKTPDFWVENNVAFEVATLFEKIVPYEYDIIEALNEIESDIKLMLGGIWNIKDKNKSLKTSKIKSQFEELFRNNSEITKLTPFVIHTEEGVILKGNMYKGKREHSTVGSISHSHGFDVQDPNYKKTARKSILKKLRKYKKLTEAGLPLVVVIYNRVDWITDVESWDEILYGDKEFEFKPNTTETLTIKRRGGIISPNKNTTLSSILIRDITTKDGYYFIDNTYARTPLDADLKSRIIKSFDGKEITKVFFN